MATIIQKLQNALPDALTGTSGQYNAIVAGATGINGLAITKALAADTRFGHVYASSRRPPPADRITHIPTDFLAEPSEIADAFKKAVPDSQRIDFVFFAAYKQEDSEEANWESNGRMLRSFLEALAMSGIEQRGLRRVLLVTGAKYYGVQLGPIKNPLEEEDGRVDGAGRPLNFYYNQEDILKSTAAGKSWDWVISMPNDVIGFARGNFMNLASALALYAVISKELGEDLWFPGSQEFYLGFDTHSYAPLVGSFQIWAATTPGASNQLFNIVNGDTPSWQANWPRLATYFDVSVPPDQFVRAVPHAAGERTTLPHPPLLAHVAEMGLIGTPAAGPSHVEARIDLAKWAERQEVKEAWKKVAKREGLDEGAFGEGTFGFANFVLGRSYSIVQSMSKARKLGWTGYIDTWDAFTETFEELAKEGIIPKRA